MSFDILPDDLHTISLQGPDGEILSVHVNARFDRVDHWGALGAWALKAFDDEQGLITVHLDEPTARKIVDATRLPIVERDSMVLSEHEGYLTAEASLLNDSLLGE